MKYILTGKQMKAADIHTIKGIGIPSMVLMERAALEVTKVITEHVEKEDSVLVVCGSGNNGGDGYAIARMLYVKGCDVTILFVGNESSRSEENRQQKAICDYYKIDQVNTWPEKEPDIVVDAIFGIGLSREVSGEYASFIEKINQSAAWTVSVDIPSGIQDETGKVMGTAVKADTTVAIAYLKAGMVLQPGNAFAGKLVIADIGINDDSIPDERKMFMLEKEDLKDWYPKRKKNSHKGSYGKIGLIVGSKGMSGAAYLCAKAAYMTGAGLVKIYTHEDNRVILQQLLPEAMIGTYSEYCKEDLEALLDWADVVCIGCGLGTDETAENILNHTIKYMKKPLVIDADGLNLLSKKMELLKQFEGSAIVTPHMKEMSRLLGCTVKELQDNRVNLLYDFVEKYGVTCVLKDARTVVAKSGEDSYLNMSGNSSMAKGGAGDVLAGIITGIFAQNEQDFAAAATGVFVHGLAGDKAKEKKGIYSVLASDLAEAVSDVLKEL